MCDTNGGNGKNIDLLNVTFLISWFMSVVVSTGVSSVF